MKLYRCIFTPNSTLNQIPDAQTLFGAFCFIIDQKYGQDKLNRYLETLNDDPWFIHSSMFPENLFPSPSENLFSIALVNHKVQNQSPKEKLSVLSDFKKYKRLQFISDAVFKTYVLKNDMERLKQEILSKANLFRIDETSRILSFKDEKVAYAGTRILQTRNGQQMDSLDKDLFYNVQLFVPKTQKFNLFIKTDHIQEIIPILKLLEYTGVGARKSIGMNQFHFETFEEIQVKPAYEKVYLLSKCIPGPEDFDFAESDYKIDSRLFRGSKTYVYGDYIGRFTRLLEGSLCQPKTVKEYYGKVVREVVDGKPIYHYGLGFVM